MEIVDRVLADQPAFHVNGTVDWASLPETLRYIAGATHGGERTIETGCGVSTVVFAASGSRHTAISPDPREHARVKEYCDRVGVDTSQVTFVEGLSDEVLPRLEPGDPIDVAFIDGAHSFPFPVVDWHYISRSMRVGGRLIVDDLPIASIAVLHRYMISEPCWRVDRLLDGRAGAYVLDSPISPEDWTNQSFNLAPDYSFLPVAQRSRAVGSMHATRLRRLAGRRLPALRRLVRDRP